MIIVEDGTVVNGANSYISEQDLREFCSDRDLSLPGGSVEPLIHKAMDYLETLNFKGEKLYHLHSVEFPRVNMLVNGWLYPAHQIPPELKKAQCLLAYHSQKIDLTPASQGRETKREKVDILEVEYSENKTETELELPFVFNTLKDFIYSQTLTKRI